MAVSKVGSNVKWAAANQVCVSNTTHTIDFPITNDIWPNANGDVSSAVTLLVDFYIVFTSSDNANYHCGFTVRAAYRYESATLTRMTTEVIGTKSSGITTAAASASGSNCRLSLTMKTTEGAGDATIKPVIRLYHDT